MTRNQRGSALVAALGVLAVMTLLATMSLLAGGADHVISTRLARERAAFYAAESALETTLEELVSEGGPIPEASFSAPWPATGVAVRNWQDGEWACSRRLCLIPDVGDVDGDPATTVVLYDRDFGFAASPLQSGGYPVLQVLVAARGGESLQAIVAEVASVTCAPVVAAAWHAAGPLELHGDVLVKGTATLPALAGAGPVQLFGGAAIDGDVAPAAQQPLSADVLQILNAGGTLPRLADLPAPSVGGSQKGLFWARGDYCAPSDGKGILVVHNPDFDPARHEASRIAIEDGTLVDGYDPSYSHLDPSRQPARLDITASGEFSGVIVADVVGAASAEYTLTGALITLSRSAQTVTAASSLRIVGSRAAVEKAGRGALRHQVGFRPVTLAEVPEECP